MRSIIFAGCVMSPVASIDAGCLPNGGTCPAPPKVPSARVPPFHQNPRLEKAATPLVWFTYMAHEMRQASASHLDARAVTILFQNEASAEVVRSQGARR
jgi:hypothetical protein